MDDLFYPERLKEKLVEVLDYHNFVLTNYFDSEAIEDEYRAILDDEKLKTFHELATEAGLAALVEVHDQAELHRF